MKCVLRAWGQLKRVFEVLALPYPDFPTYSPKCTNRWVMLIPVLSDVVASRGSCANVVNVSRWPGKYCTVSIIWGVLKLPQPRDSCDPELGTTFVLGLWVACLLPS